MTNHTSKQPSPKRTVQGIIVEARQNGLYLVHTEGGYCIQAHLGTTLRKFNIRMIPGDNVKLELSPFDINRGKITQCASHP